MTKSFRALGALLVMLMHLQGQIPEPEIYQVVRIFNPSQPTLDLLQEAGLALDEGRYEPGEFYEVVASQNQVEALVASGISLEVRIPDLGAWTIARNRPATQRDFPLGSLMGNYTYDEAVARMDSLHAQFPALVSEKIALGTTLESRTIWAIKVSDNPEVDENEPEVLYTGLTHAREPVGMMNLFYFIQTICENYYSDSESAFLINQRELWFVPILNPDGYVWNEVYYNTYASPGYHRKNRLDTGCGTGTSRGVDLNRNYSFNWGGDYGSSGNPCAATYRGTAAFSELETSILQNFVLSRDFQNILHYHSYSNVLIHSFGNDSLPAEPDLTMITEIGTWMTSENGYQVGTGYSTLGYRVCGDAVDWSYGELGLLSYTPEVGSYMDYFWPSEDRVLPLCQDQVYQNKVFATVAGSDPAVRSFSLSADTVGSGGIVDLEVLVQNRGLNSTNGPVTVTWNPVNESLAVLAAPASLMPLDSRAIDTVAVSLAIPFSAPANTTTGLQITVSDSLSFPRTRLVLVTIGNPAALAGDLVTDLRLSLQDLIALADLLLGIDAPTPYQSWLADLNGDSQITADDLVALINLILEL